MRNWPHRYCCIIVMLMAVNQVFGQTTSDSLLLGLRGSTSDSAKISLLFKVAEFYTSVEANDQMSENYVREAEHVAIRSSDAKLLANVYNQMGTYYRKRSRFAEARLYHSKALEKAIEQGDSLIMSASYNAIGVVYRRVDNFALATENHMNALRIAESIGDDYNESVACNSLGNIFTANGQYSDALTYFKRGLELSIKDGNKLGEAINLNNIGEAYEQMGEVDKANELYNKSLELNKEINSRQGISISYNCLGRLALNAGNARAAYNYFKAAYDIDKQLPDLHYTATSYVNLGRAVLAMGKPEMSRRYAERVMEIGRTIGSSAHCQQALELFSSSYYKQGLYAEAYDYMLQANRYRDSLQLVRSTQSMATMQALYESEKREQEIVILRQEQELASRHFKTQRIRIYALCAGMALMLGVSIWIFALLRNKHSINRLLAQQIVEVERSNFKLAEQKEEISSQKEDIIRQKELIAQQNTNLRTAYRTIERYVQNMTDSLHYAERIQESMLPSMDSISATFSDTMLVNRPKDIVSGDFYFLSPTADNRILFALADCTGHGVPGAFMSIIGINLLNDAIQRRIGKADELLAFLHERLLRSLKRNESDNVLLDSMDIAICLYDPATRELDYAGALISAMVVRNGSLITLKHKAYSLGSVLRGGLPVFTSERMVLQPGDWLYMSSDGFYDQLGGPKCHKYQRSRFTEMIVRMSALDGKQQEAEVVKEFEQWRDRREQIDDVLVWGVKI